ncbi:hypothetical protein ACWDYH_35815 [Nocardia goodfellowii]
MQETMFSSQAVTTRRTIRRAARIAVCAALAIPGAAATCGPAAAAPVLTGGVQAHCLAHTEFDPDLHLRPSHSTRDTITCTNGVGVPLIAGKSEVLLDAQTDPCGPRTATITTRWDDGTQTVTKTHATIGADRIYTASGTATADSTRFAGASTRVSSTGHDPLCSGETESGIAVYTVTFLN